MHEKAAVGYEPLHTTPRAEVAHKGKDASTDTRQFSQNWFPMSRTMKALNCFSVSDFFQAGLLRPSGSRPQPARSDQVAEQRFCVFQITHVETLGEPLIGRREQLTRRGTLALL